MSATPSQISELAGAIAAQAEAIEKGTVNGRLLAAAKLLASNIETLVVWVEQAERDAEADRSTTELAPVSLAGETCRVLRVMDEVIIKNPAGETVGRGISRTSALRDARQGLDRAATVAAGEDPEATPAEDAPRYHSTDWADRVSVARLKVGDRVSFEASTKLAASFRTVTGVESVTVGQRRGYRIELAGNTTEAGDYGASTAVWRLS